jgi:ADP-ribose pyrophosphatase YjhB (NUDIX family)
MRLPRSTCLARTLIGEGEALNLPIATVGALIYDPAGRMLVIRTHKWRNSYGVPGGKIDTDETMEAALIREVREETGLSVRDVQFVLVQDCVQSPEFYKPAHFLLLNFTCHCDGGQVVLNEEAQEFAWVTVGEALALPLNSFTRRLIEAVHGPAT